MADLTRCLADVDEWIRLVPNSDIVVAGDFNIRAGPWSPDYTLQANPIVERADALLQWANSHALSLITPPNIITHVGGSNTIDLSFSNTPKSEYHLGAATGTDHYPAFFRTTSHHHMSPLGRSLRAVNLEQFPGTLRRLLLSAADDCSEWKDVLSVIDKAIAACRPSGSGRKRGRAAEQIGWDDNCQRIKASRDALFSDPKWLCQSPLNGGGSVPKRRDRLNPAGRLKYNQLTTDLSKASRTATDMAVSGKLGKLTTRQEWIHAKVRRNMASSRNVLSPPLTNPSGAVCSSTTSKLALLAETIFPQAQLLKASSLPLVSTTAPNGPPPATDPLPTPSRAPPFLAPLAPSELDAALAAMAADKAAGPDEVGPNLLKECCGCAEFRSTLFLIANRCITEGRFPPEWKEAIITVIPKLGKRDLTLPTSYRPISLLNTAAKLVEAIVCKRLQHALLSRGLLRCQYGGTPGISTSHAVAHVLDVAKTASKSGREVTLVSIDVTSAFNCIEHRRLIQELQSANLSGFASWISSWLDGRTFRLRLENTLSAKYSMSGAGVPQGSPLSPLLWAFYVDSIFQQPLPRGVSLSGAYVDDLFAVTAGRSVEEAASAAQRWVDLVVRWSAERNLTLDKPGFLVVSRTGRQRALPDVRLTFGDTSVPPSNLSIRLLGVIINSRLSHNDFVTRKCNQVRYSVNILHRTIREIGEIDLLTRLKLAKTILIPILDYASEVHPIVTGVTAREAFKAEKDIWLFVLDLFRVSATPTSITLAFELGQHSHVFRWRHACLLFTARLLATPGHASTDHARAVLRTIGSSTDLSFGIANLFQHIGESHLPGALTGAATSALRTATRVLHPRVSEVETISIPQTAPQDWDPLKVHILPRDAARQAEYRSRTLRKSHAVRIYADGSQITTERGDHRLGAAFVAHADSPSMEWNGATALHGSNN